MTKIYIAIITMLVITTVVLLDDNKPTDPTTIFGVEEMHLAGYVVRPLSYPTPSTMVQTATQASLGPPAGPDGIPTIGDRVTRPKLRRDDIIIAASQRYQTVQFDENEIKCLAANIYHESRGEGRIGMIAVARVTLNRVESNKFPDTVCEVVYQRGQFAWVVDGISAITESLAYAKSVDAATFIYENRENTYDFTLGALYFLSPMKNPPRWSRSFTETYQYRRHTFYRP